MTPERLNRAVVSGVISGGGLLVGLLRSLLAQVLSAVGWSLMCPFGEGGHDGLEVLLLGRECHVLFAGSGT